MRRLVFLANLRTQRLSLIYQGAVTGNGYLAASDGSKIDCWVMQHKLDSYAGGQIETYITGRCNPPQFRTSHK